MKNTTARCPTDQGGSPRPGLSILRVSAWNTLGCLRAMDGGADPRRLRIAGRAVCGCRPANSALAVVGCCEIRRLAVLRIRSWGYRRGATLGGSESSCALRLVGVISTAGTQARRPDGRAGRFFPKFCLKRATLGVTLKKQQRPIIFRRKGAAAKHKRFPCTLPPQSAKLQGRRPEPCGCSTLMEGTRQCCGGCISCWRAGSCR